MDRQEIIDKYNKGQLSTGEEKLLEQYIERGEISIEDLDDLAHLKTSMSEIVTPDPSAQMSSAFYEQLAKAQRKAGEAKNGSWFANLWNSQPALRWAYSLGLLLVGVGAGFLFQTGADKDERLENLSAEVSEMKEMMMLTLLEKDSPSDRLKAVSLTSEMSDVSLKVTEALLKTLNSDKNVNVRLATVEALYSYASHPKVREGLIRSIPQQESPLVQMALAEMMVALQEKKSVEGLKGIVNDKNTPPEVKARIEKSIEVLI